MPPDRSSATKAKVLLLGSLLTVAAGCSYVPRPHWPWHHKPEAAPEVVHDLVNADGTEAPYPQYWKGNTLIVDLRLGGAQGNTVLKPREHTVWPVRIAFRVLPNQAGEIEVHAAQRVVLPITNSGTKPVDLELAPGVFIMKSPQMTVSWGPVDQSSGT